MHGSSGPERRPATVASILTPISRLFLPAGLAVVIAVAAIYVTVRHRSVLPILVGVAAGTLAWALSSAAKAVADRPRPYEVLADAVLRQDPARGTSFPSNHTAVAVAVVVALVPFLPRPLGYRGDRLRRDLGRMVTHLLGVHYPLDVLGGAGIGLAVGGLDSWPRGSFGSQPTPGGAGE